MNSEHHIRLTSAEIAQLWSGYTNNSMSKCVLKYFKEKTQDEEIRPVIDTAISITDKMLQNITEIYVKENQMKIDYIPCNNKNKKRGRAQTMLKGESISWMKRA
jgi:hypothetical protein